jgi:hypothetical protein
MPPKPVIGLYGSLASGDKGGGFEFGEGVVNPQPEGIEGDEGNEGEGHDRST